MRHPILATATAIAIATASTVANAQTAAGLKLAASISKLDVEGFDMSSLVGFDFGPYFWFGRGPVGLQAEALYVRKGAKQNDIGVPNGEGRIKIDYVEVPATLLFKSARGPYAFAGPAAALEVACRQETKIETSTSSVGCDSPNSTMFERRKIDLSAVGGAGYRLRFGRAQIMLEGRYTHGFVNINKNEADVDVKNRSFAILASYSALARRR